MHCCDSNHQNLCAVVFAFQEELKTALIPLKEKLKLYKKAKVTADQVTEHIKVIWVFEYKYIFCDLKMQSWNYWNVARPQLIPESYVFIGSSWAYREPN